jgi:hypothetical protein
MVQARELGLGLAIVDAAPPYKGRTGIVRYYRIAFSPLTTLSPVASSCGNGLNPIVAKDFLVVCKVVSALTYRAQLNEKMAATCREETSQAIYSRRIKA